MAPSKQRRRELVTASTDSPGALLDNTAAAHRNRKSDRARQPTPAAHADVVRLGASPSAIPVIDPNHQRQDVIQRRPANSQS